MAIYTSNTNRVTGLSGMDTESMIDKMMQAESFKYDNMQRDEILLSWRQDAYRDIINKMQEFQDKWFGVNTSTNLGFDSAWNKYDFSVTDSNGKDSNDITINNSSVDKNYDIEVTQAAQTESITGKDKTSNSITTGKTATEILTSIDELSKDGGELALSFDLGGMTKKISISKAEIDAKGVNREQALTDVLNEKLKSAFGTKSDGSAQVSVGKNTDGKLEFKSNVSTSLSIRNDPTITKGTSITQKGILAKDKEGNYELSLQVGSDTYTINVKFEKDDDTADKRLKKITEALEKGLETAGSDVKSGFSISASGDDLVITNTSRSSDVSYSVTSTFTDKTTGKAEVESGTIKTQYGASYIGIDSTKSTSVTSSTSIKDAFGEAFNSFFNTHKTPDDTIKLNFGGKDIEISGNDSIDTFINKVNDSGSGIKLSFNGVTRRFKMESTTSGDTGNIDIASDSSVDQKSKDFLKDIIGIDVTNKETGNDSFTKGQDAIYKVDGIEVRSHTNDINMDGLNFTINRPTTGGPVTISASMNQGDTKEMITDFVKDYNELVGELEALVNKPREKAGKYDYYEPLLDKEKEEMSEDEIEKWEEKAKTGLLYRDDFLSGLLNDLRKIPFQGIDIGGGKTLSLYEIGISTNDHSTGKLSINDSLLDKALTERPDEIRKLFTSSGQKGSAQEGIASKMDNILDDLIGTRGTLRDKAGIKDTTSEKNNLMSKALRDMRTRRDAERQRLQNKEMQYFDMFARMEAVMNKQNSQMGMLLSSLGQM